MKKCREYRYIIKRLAVVILGAVTFMSCADDEDGTFPEAATLRVYASTVDVPAVTDAEPTTHDNSFVVLFWNSGEHLSSGAVNPLWKLPYLAGYAPQPIDFYQHNVFDTRYPYPDEDRELYATGYSPGRRLTPSDIYGYRVLYSAVEGADVGRCDFLGCDAWTDVYKGKQTDPFAQEKNRLYFRHLGAKLVFYAERDMTMENKQYVRQVRVTNLYMSVGGGEWMPMYTPSVFTWSTLNESEDFTQAYRKAIEKIKGVEDNAGVTSVPSAGYKTTVVEEFAGPDASFALLRRNADNSAATDRVPIGGMVLDSCYVASPINAGVVSRGNIRLRMDISAEMSFDPNFPQRDEGASGGSTTDDLTFTREWKNVTLDAIYEVQINADGTVTKKPDIVREFKAGNEYRVYITFSRTGVDLVARELPWNFGGVHHIVIIGGDKVSE